MLVSQKTSPLRVEKVKEELKEAGVDLEEDGGDVQCINVAAPTGQGLDDLLDAIGLLSEMIDLSTDLGTVAQGTVIEAKTDKKFGVCATMIMRHGIFLKSNRFRAICATQDIMFF